MEIVMAERYAVGILPGIGWRAHEIEVIAREAACAAERNRKVA
jgi:hypothetical protein